MTTEILRYYESWETIRHIHAIRPVTSIPKTTVVNPPQVANAYFIDCPFDDNADHLAVINLKLGEYLSTPYWARTGLRVIYCSCCNRHAWGEFEHLAEMGDKLVPAKALMEVLRMEEEQFNKLIKKFAHLKPHSMTPEKAVVLWHSHGCPEEIAAEVSTNSREFYKLVEEHKATGKKGDKKKSVYQA